MLAGIEHTLAALRRLRKAYWQSHRSSRLGGAWRTIDTRQPIPEAPRLIWDAVGTADRLPLHVRARGEFEYVGRKLLGDGFTSVPVREMRGALLRAFGNGRIDLGLNFLAAAGSTGQTTEVLALSSEPTPFERVVGVPLKSYVGASFTYNFGRRETGRTR